MDLVILPEIEKTQKLSLESSSKQTETYTDAMKLRGLLATILFQLMHLGKAIIPAVMYFTYRDLMV